MDDNKDLINKIKSFGYDIRQIGYKDQEHADKGIYNYRYWIIPEENQKLKDTKFYYNKEKEFIHFTSIEALFGILNSKHLRLYNLPNMDDKYELEYALKALSFIDTDDKNEIKEQLYILSMCSASLILNEEPKKKKHILWKLHGHDGKGVILKLKIENDLSTWYNYYLTECFYTLDNFKAIEDLHKKTNNELLDTKLASFIKLPIYEFENEIRLVFDKRNSGWINDKDNTVKYPVVYPDKLNQAENISYVQLPLLNFFKNNPDAYPTPPNGLQLKYEIPKISISEIILGYRYNDNDLENFKKKIKSFDPNISVRLSDLKQYY
jgi:hypothetical protein